MSFFVIWGQAKRLGPKVRLGMWFLEVTQPHLHRGNCDWSACQGMSVKRARNMQEERSGCCGRPKSLLAPLKTQRFSKGIGTIHETWIEAICHCADPCGTLRAVLSVRAATPIVADRPCDTSRRDRARGITS